MVMHCGLWFMFNDGSKWTNEDPVDLKKLEDKEVTITKCAFPDMIPIDLRVKLAVCLIYQNLHDIVKAVIEPLFEENIEEMGDLYLDVAEAYMENKYYHDAKPILQQLVCSAHYNLAAVWLKFAECLNSLGEFDHAVQAFSRVVELAPAHVGARMSLSTLQQKLGKHEEAIQALSRGQSDFVMWCPLIPVRLSTDYIQINVSCRVIVVNVVPTHTCAHEPPICLNEAKCIAVSATDHKCQCYPGYSNWDCSLIDETVLVGGTSCPGGFQPETCSCGSNSGKLKTSDGTANIIQYSSGRCSLVPGCQTCQLQARCKIFGNHKSLRVLVHKRLEYDCGCLNKGHCHKVTGQCVCKDGYYGNKCELFDYCAFYEDTHNASACGASGMVGPPFACGVKFDGSESSYINLGPWSPGPVYTVAAWVRPSGSGKTRRVSDDYGCSRGIDSGVTVQNGKWYLVATTNNGTHVTIYVNGHTNTVKVKPYLLPTTYGFWIGGEQCCKMGRTKGLIKVGKSVYFSLRLTMVAPVLAKDLTVKVWKRALQPTEIANSMKNDGNVNSSMEAMTQGLVGHWELGETITPPCIGTDHGGSKPLINSENNRGGGGGGLGGSARTDKRGQPGGGGGYGTVGTSNFKLKGDRSGVGEFGTTYGDDTLKPSYMGSGGGSGGNAADLTNNTKGGKGGNGGGSISIVAAQSVLIRGVVSVRGEAGQGDVTSNVWCTGCPAACNHLSTVDCYGNSTRACWDMSGPGGGGSGGSIYIEGKLVDIEQEKFDCLL
ncbi:hypothetical protein KUTeg_015164 [Tegillarca granosa]|uniref:EGF-like domain-containing protein n=1 Tax=Tegillarca granosa TaxID=220873 RepID=A0ABQ9EUJ7_TEGGR|nr:hypothetical protein KUTeg_015164 [Tegillarca granosa]